MKALFVPFAPSLAHVGRCLAVAEAWRTAGHQAVFACGAERRAFLAEAGFEARELPEVAAEVFKADRGLRWLTPAHVRDTLAAEARLLAAERPDAVVLDFRFTTALAAGEAGVPSASILHGTALKLVREPAAAARELVGEGPGARQRLLRAVFPRVFSLVMRTAVRRVRTVLADHGAPEVETPFGLLQGDLTLAADLPELLPPSLPPRTAVVGPLRWSGWERPAPWLEALDARPVVYVTLGSTGDAGALVPRLLQALGDGAFQVVLGAAGPPPPGGDPPHVHRFATVPGATVAARSALVVHHGGHETLVQALAAGVPSLMLPSNPDQVLVAAQAARLGVGRSLWPEGALPFEAGALEAYQPRQVRAALEAVLADADARERCRSLQARLRGQRSAEAAAAALTALGKAPA